MKQILQNLSSGETLLADVPAPKVRAGHLLIETEASLVSLGTEKMLIDFGKANWLDKARQQPEKVKQVLQKIKTDGLMPTIEVVRSKLDAPLPLGYCNVGRVIEVGAGVEDFQVGDRVLSNSNHAEIVCAPKNLCCKVPDGVAPKAAVYAVVGAIGLQGIRLLKPTLGETFVVMGLGLIGQLAVQILLASGCKVIGTDFDSSKCELAREWGAEAIDLSQGTDAVKAAEALTGGIGVDGVLITASTKSDEPIHQAATMCRKRGRIVLVGVVGMKMQRSDFYEKELSFQVSCAYGPGRYDPTFEEKGQDYPLPYVRWTEQRNFEAVLGLMAAGKLNTEKLTSHTYDFDEALEAYQQVGAGAMGIVLRYAQDGNADVARQRGDGAPQGVPETQWRVTDAGALKAAEEQKLKRVITVNPAAAPAKAVVGVIGAGSFTSLVIVPALKKTSARLKSISSGTGVSGAHLAKKFGFENTTTDNDTIFNDPEINVVFITTRHASHGALVLQALEAGKHVFVEKPLCIHKDEMEKVEAFFNNNPGPESEPTTQPLDHSTTSPLLMVGFNRRFSPLAVKMRELLSGSSSPMSMICTINAGMVPADHWTQDRDIGGGRIIGEACHFIDFCRFLAGARINNASIEIMGKSDNNCNDVATIQLRFENHSTATVHYFANGNKGFPKERMEVFSEGRILQLDNFKQLKGFGFSDFKKMQLWSQDKGHKNEIQEWIACIEQGRPQPIALNEILEVSRAALEIG